MADEQHNGTCAFCGSPVATDFFTCKGCGATWHSVTNGWGVIVFQVSWLAALVVAFVVGVETKAFAPAVSVFIGVAVIGSCLGKSMRTTAWFR